MGRLPIELVDRILLDLDEKTLGVLYDRGALKDMVSAPAAREIEEKVLRKARGEHKRLLSFVHSDVIYIYNYICFLYWYGYSGLDEDTPQGKGVKWTLDYYRCEVNRSHRYYAHGTK